MGTPTRSTFSLLNAIITDTPPKPKHTLTTPAFTNGLKEGRKAVMNDLEFAIPVVHMTYFQTALLPPLRVGLNVDDIVTRLQKAGHLNKEKCWTTLFRVQPSKAHALENDVFQDFEHIATAVRRAAGEALTSWAEAHPDEDVRPTALFRCNSNMTPMYGTRKNVSKPDCYASLDPDAPLSKPTAMKTSGPPRVLWDDIVAPGEFKKAVTAGSIHDVSMRNSAVDATIINVLCRIIAN